MGRIFYVRMDVLRLGREHAIDKMREEIISTGDLSLAVQHNYVRETQPNRGTRKQRKIEPNGDTAKQIHSQGKTQPSEDASTQQEPEQ